jgi:anti-repressor protein
MTDNSVQVFNSEQFGEVRALTIDNQPWFVASDVAKALGYRMASDMTRRLDEDEKGTRSMRTPSGEQDMTIITEAGMYSAILGSKLPEAKAFKRWVTHDVLPSIRSHGVYATPQTIERMLNDPDTMITTLKVLKAERERANALMEDNARLLPKATAYDIAIEAEGTMSITEAARQLSQYDKSINRKRLFALLRADGLICKQDNAPTKKAIQRGYMVQMMTTRTDGKANDPYARMTRKGLDWCMRHYCSAHVVA